jgi:C-terminal processing protease CtpA/Prc
MPHFASRTAFHSTRAGLRRLFLPLAAGVMFIWGCTGSTNPSAGTLAARPVWTTSRPPEAPAPAVLERLTLLADLYGAVFYFHPDVAASQERRTAWDRAVAVAVEVLVAQPDADYQTVVAELLASLRDPATGLAGSVVAAAPGGPQRARRYRGHPPDVQNFYTGGFRPFEVDWEQLPAASEWRRHTVELGDGVRAVVRTSGSADGDVGDAAGQGHGPAAVSAYPRLGERVIAAYRARNVVRYFYPYAHLIEEDWGDVIRRSIPGLVAAVDSVEYALAVAEMVTHFHDSHVSVSGGGWDAVMDRPRPPIGARMIDGDAVVVGFSSDSARNASGLRRGDVIVAVDGEPVEDRTRRLGRYLAASTPQAARDKVMSYLLIPAPGRSTVRIRALRADGGIVESEVGVSDRWWLAFRERRGEPAIRRIGADIGYVDLTLLTPAQVDSAFTTLRDTRAIIFDLRGYPRGTAWSIAPRLVRPGAGPTAYSWTPVASSPAGSSEAGVATPVPTADDVEPYRGRTVLLLDERANSQSEYTAMMFRAANGSAFIGTPTNGANGDVTDFVVPGALRVSFSGTGSRFPDGTRLQRRGIHPDVYVAPTLEGIRAGRDEVLDAAIRFLEDERIHDVPAADRHSDRGSASSSPGHAEITGGE